MRMLECFSLNGGIPVDLVPPTEYAHSGRYGYAKPGVATRQPPCDAEDRQWFTGKNIDQERVNRRAQVFRWQLWRQTQPLTYGNKRQRAIRSSSPVRGG